MDTIASTIPDINEVTSILKLVSIFDISPSIENEKIYRTINEDDQGILTLAESIRAFGILESIVVSRDMYIISGHRRHFAAKLAGVKNIEVSIMEITSDNQNFVKYIREFNRQRVKGYDEQLREAVIDSDPEESYRMLLEYRKGQNNVDISTINIEGHKIRASISKAKMPFLLAAIQVIREREKFLPLTIRQIHYALLNNPPLKNTNNKHSRYSNDIRSYQNLSGLLTRARLEGYIPFDVIVDETRPNVIWKVFPDTSPFIKEHIDNLLKGYYRDLLQSQPDFIQIIGEKNTIAGVIKPIAEKYRVPYIIGRGFNSIDPMYKLAQKFKKVVKEN